jgi:tetratricopeptide (TPR) repeat protein
LKPALAGVLAPACACLLSACAGPGGDAPRELKTASDQTASEKRAQIRLQLAVGYYQDRKYEIALDEVKQAIAAAPDYADAYGVRALIYTAMGENALADENYRHALRLAPRNPDLANNYGLFLCDAGGKPAEAMGYFESALKQPRLRLAGQGPDQCRQLQPETEEYRRGRALPARGLALRPRAAGHPGRPGAGLFRAARCHPRRVFHQPPDGDSETRYAVGRRAVAGHPGQAHAG